MLTHRLRHRVTFEECVNVQEGSGAWLTTWRPVFIAGMTLFNVPAEVLTGPGKERLMGGAVHAETTARITLRWFPGLKPDWRILWEDRTFNITSIETDRTGRREYRLTCKDLILN